MFLHSFACLFFISLYSLLYRFTFPPVFFFLPHSLSYCFFLSCLFSFIEACISFAFFDYFLVSLSLFHSPFISFYFLNINNVLIFIYSLFSFCSLHHRLSTSASYVLPSLFLYPLLLSLPVFLCTKEAAGGNSSRCFSIPQFIAMLLLNRVWALTSRTFP